MAGITPVGPVSGIQGFVAVEDNPEWTAEQVTGNPQQIGHAPGYWESPVRYPGQLWSLGYGDYPTMPLPDTEIMDEGAAVPPAGLAGPDTAYFDATPNTHAGPWPAPVMDSHRPEEAAFLREQSAVLHADGYDNRKPGLAIAAAQDQWQELYNSPTDDAIYGDGGSNRHVSAGWGSTDSVQNPDGNNTHTDYPQHNHRRVATGHNLPMDFLWLPGGQRPLITTVRGLQALPVGTGGPFEGQDPAYGYGSAGGVLTMPAGDYQAPASPYTPPPLTQQGLLEAPLTG